MDALAIYRQGTEANDVDLFMSAIAPDAEVVSPLAARAVFRGTADLRILLGAVYSTIRDLQWREEIGEGSKRVVIGDCRIGPFGVTDAMAVDLGPDGRIVRIRPHLRPWLATTLFALLIGPQVARHPGVVWRALRAGFGR